MERTETIFESLELGTLMALSGGFMDAYSYAGRGHVFANAQTGNLLLFGVNLSEGNFAVALCYFWPVLAFAGGIALADYFRRRHRDDCRLHWMQVSILLEAVILFAAGFLPQRFNLPANCMVSFACGVQVESFRRINGHGIATTMCIGNLRAATEYFCDYICEKNPPALRRAALFAGVIVVFVVGAVFGNFAVKAFAERAIWCSSLLLLVGFGLMFFEDAAE